MTSSPSPQAPPAASPLTLESLAAQLESFVRGVVTLDPEQAAIRAGLTFLVVIGAAMLVWGLRVMLKALTERVAPEEPDAPKKRPPIGRWSLGIARFAIIVVALLAILRVWGFDYSDLREGPLGAVFATAARIALILVIAFAAIEVSQLAITRMFARMARRAKNPRRAAQVRTLAPLLSGVITTTMIVLAAMMSLSEIGVQIGPLIAGAGIVGLAIGFGAQTLVKDFLTGIFLIIEDAVSIGDVVAIGAASGVVEDMSLRTIKLRAFDGTLQVIPYGEAQIIYNRTKGFSNAVFDIGISYAADIGKALEIMRETGKALHNDSELGGDILEPIEILGVDGLADASVRLKARIRTRPGSQWRVQRAYLQRVATAFDAAGVELGVRAASPANASPPPA